MIGAPLPQPTTVTVAILVARLDSPRYVGDPRHGGRVGFAGDVVVTWPGGAASVLTADEWAMLHAEVPA